MSSELDKNWLGAILKNKGLPELLAKAGNITVVPIDPDLSGATRGQAWLMLKGFPDLTPQMTDAVSVRADCVGMKLNALRYHRRRYEEIQARRIEEFSSREDLKSAVQRGIKIAEVDMLCEVEAFFAQYKSCLDMLVKVLCPITGLQPGTLSTYGNDGDGVIKTLKKFKKNKNHKLTVGRIDWLIEEIEKAKPWLQSVIRVRDTYTHYRSEIHFGFEWDMDAQVLRVPMSEVDGENRPLNLVMAELTEPIITYSANFIAIAVSCAIPLTTQLETMDESAKAYIGARWQLNLSRAIWKIGTNVIRIYSAEDIENARRAAEDANRS